MLPLIDSGKGGVMKKIVVFLGSLAFLFLFVVRSQAIIIDLNDFYYEGNVEIASDGSWAKLIEDPNYNSVFLSNDPYWGASYPGIYIPLDAMTLTFYYEFTEPTGNVDEFYVFLYDLSQYPTPLTDRHGNQLAFHAYTTSSGTVTWDLYGASFLGTTVGMEFQLNWLQGDPYPSNNLDENSSVIIRDLKINTVPEPSTIFLVGCAILGLILLRRGSNRKLN